MGKSKKRIFNRNTDEKGLILKRDEVVSLVLHAIRSNNINEDISKYISLFGITTEELLEEGADFEEVSAVKHLFI